MCERSKQWSAKVVKPISEPPTETSDSAISLCRNKMSQSDHLGTRWSYLNAGRSSAISRRMRASSCTSYHVHFIYETRKNLLRPLNNSNSRNIIRSLEERCNTCFFTFSSLLYFTLVLWLLYELQVDSSYFFHPTDYLQMMKGQTKFVMLIFMYPNISFHKRFTNRTSDVS